MCRVWRKGNSSKFIQRTSSFKSNLKKSYALLLTVTTKYQRCFRCTDRARSIRKLKGTHGSTAMWLRSPVKPWRLYGVKVSQSATCCWKTACVHKSLEISTPLAQEPQKEDVSFFELLKQFTPVELGSDEIRCTAVHGPGYEHLHDVDLVPIAAWVEHEHEDKMRELQTER